VVATGPFFSVPYIPSVAVGLAGEVTQLHTSEYRGPDQIAAGRVVVVGGGNSGFQIAAELASSGRTVDLSESRRNRCVPQRPLGRDLFWWLDGLGLIRATADSRLGAKLKARGVPVIGSSRKGLRRRGVGFRPRTTSAAGGALTFADGSTSKADTVV
jgi:putative flavoprotein involved in K+ transport